MNPPMSNGEIWNLFCFGSLAGVNGLTGDINEAVESPSTKSSPVRNGQVLAFATRESYYMANDILGGRTPDLTIDFRRKHHGR